MTSSAKPDYGLDAPGLVRFFFIIGAVLAVAGFLILKLRPNSLVAALAGTAMVTGVIFFLEALAMTWSSRVGKLKARDRLLGNLNLRGDEQVLDVGCGRGLLLIGAAHRVPTGKAVGLDLWSQQDLSDNRQSETLANAAAEGVGERVEVENGDMRKMPFGDGTFDAIVASNSIHNIYDRNGRREAIREIVRVLKPGGQVALLDIRHTAEYAEDLRAMGLNDVTRTGLIFWIFPPVRTVTGRKP